MENGTNRPDVDVKALGLEEHTWESTAPRDDFDTDRLSIHYQSLRVLFDDE